MRPGLLPSPFSYHDGGNRFQPITPMNTCNITLWAVNNFVPIDRRVPYTCTSNLWRNPDIETFNGTGPEPFNFPSLGVWTYYQPLTKQEKALLYGDGGGL